MPLPLVFDQLSQPGIMRWTSASRLWLGCWIKRGPLHFPGNYMLCAGEARGAGRFLCSSIPLKLDQPSAACDGDCFRATENVQLGEDVAQCRFTVVSLMKRFAPISKYPRPSIASLEFVNHSQVLTSNVLPSLHLTPASGNILKNHRGYSALSIGVDLIFGWPKSG